ncbi:helicase-associated domain-containing protein [Streptacidiphilus sp. N1-3]|uniref:Helicase-associated domain-containing protein n=1 Tax=Streptacidiphilus alkalitolerans TaxID=3342712 RepID=A0ABV6X486_9ACTN
MKTLHLLTERLAGLTRDELAELLDARRVRSTVLRPGSGPQYPGSPHAGSPQAGAASVGLERLAAALLEDRSVAEAVGRLDTPSLQLLGGAVWLAARRHGVLREQPYWTQLEPSERPVAVPALLDFLAGDDAGLRQAVERTLAALRRLLLVLPADGGELALPAFVHRHLAEAVGLSRPAAQLMSESFNAPEVHRIAAGLDLPAVRNRDAAQAAVAALLADRERVRALLDAAPPEVRGLVDRLVREAPRLRARCFVPLGGFHYGAGTKYQLRPGGSGSAEADWLAEHGMLAPVGPELVELVHEVVDAVADGKVTGRFDPEPPRLAAGVRPVPDSLSEAQSAAASASRKAELLLAACAAAPPAIRKVGGLAVRDTRRLAKAIGAEEEQTRLWIDLAYNADLLGEYQEPSEAPAPHGRGRRAAVPSGPLRLLPTGRYDAWLAGPPAERLVPLAAVWAVLPEVLTWWPEHREETPVALVAPQDPDAVPLRRQLLTALATLPPGQGLGPAAGLGSAGLAELVRLVGWLCPAGLGGGPAAEGRTLATLREAELLGAVAHGRLTPLGTAVLELLGTDAAEWFPAVPGIAAGGEDYRPAVDGLRTAAAGLLPPPQRTARFQADLTAIASGAPSAELAELLGSAADRESEGHAVVWRFSAASVRRALDGGLSGEDLLAGLREVAEGTLPQPLEYLVRDTGRTHGRVRVVRSACCVRSDDEALVLELSKSRMLAKVGLRRIAPTVLISTHSPAATLEALRAAGYAPVLEAETGVTVVERAPERRAEQRMPDLSRLRRGGARGAETVYDLAERLMRGI